MNSVSFSLRETAVEIVRRMQTAGFATFWVGGCVRDFLLGREPLDYDIATDVRPEQIEKLFKRTIAVGRKFGVMVVVEDKHQFQVATFRAEADYRDGRHPEQVTFGDAEADARRVEGVRGVTNAITVGAAAPQIAAPTRGVGH